MKDGIELIIGETYYFAFEDNRPIKGKLKKIHDRVYINDLKQISIEVFNFRKSFKEDSYVIYSDEIRLTRKEALKKTVN